MTSTDLSPIAIAPHLRSMGWAELDQLAGQILSRMSLVAEGTAASLQGRVSSGKPCSMAPHGEQSLHDRHREAIAAASQHDLQAHYAAQAAGEEPPAPSRYRQAIFRAAIELRNQTHRPDQTPHDLDPEDTSVERTDWIIASYEGLEAHDAAALESARAGWVSSEAIRKVRHRNGRHRATGRPKPSAPAEIREAITTAYRVDPTRSLRDIAAELDLGKDLVRRIIAELEAPDQGARAA
jgi:hypothetical protein